MITKDFAQHLFEQLGEACGLPLTMVEGSFSNEGVFAPATARSWELPRAPLQVSMNIRAELLFTSIDDGSTEVWALVFFYIDGMRVAPPGHHHLTLRWERGEGVPARWVRKSWEADEYDEWTEAERLDDTER